MRRRGLAGIPSIGPLFTCVPAIEETASPPEQRRKHAHLYTVGRAFNRVSYARRAVTCASYEKARRSARRSPGGGRRDTAPTVASTVAQRADFLSVVARPRIECAFNCHFDCPVPPRRPTIVAKEGQMSSSATLAPLQLGQPLSLSCETSGGNVDAASLEESPVNSINWLIESGKPLPRLIWLRDGRAVDETFVRVFDDTVRNDLWMPSLGRQDLDAVLTCEASNSNSTPPLAASVQIDLVRELAPFNFAAGSKSSARLRP